MKKLRTLLIGLMLVILPTISHAGVVRGALQGVIGASVAAGGGGASYFENFETGTTPTGWTASSTDILYNNTAQKLDGTYSASSNTASTSSSRNIVTATFTDTADVYISLHYMLHTADYGELTYVIQFQDSSGNGLGGITADGTTNALKVKAQGGTSVAIGTSALVQDTPIYLKIRYQAGTGSNATVTAWTSSDGTTWSSAYQSTNGTVTASAGKLSFNNGSGNNLMFVIDNIIKSATDITDAR